MPATRLVILLTTLALLVTACGGDDASKQSATPTVVVTHSILGDIVEAVVGDQAEVVTIMGPGADPHGFSASAQEVDQMRRADALIANGGRFEVGLLDVIDAARGDGVPTLEAIGDVRALTLPTSKSADKAVDPHFFTDPTRVADAVDGIVEFLASRLDALDVAALRASADAYKARLAELDGKIDDLVSAIAPRDRVMVTNHQVFGYFADRYGFTVVGTVLPGGSTDAAASAASLADLAEIVRVRDVPAIFVERSAPPDLAETVAAEVGPVEVVPLFSESLGDPGSNGATYLDMMATNAGLIVDALEPGRP